MDHSTDEGLSCPGYNNVISSDEMMEEMSYINLDSNDYSFGLPSQLNLGIVNETNVSTPTASESVMPSNFRSSKSTSAKKNSDKLETVVAETIAPINDVFSPIDYQDLESNFDTYTVPSHTNAVPSTSDVDLTADSVSSLQSDNAPTYTTLNTVVSAFKS